MLEYSVNMFSEFLRDLSEYNKSICELEEDATQETEACTAEKLRNLSAIVADAEQNVKQFTRHTDSIHHQSRSEIEQVITDGIKKLRSIFERLSRCKEQLILLEFAEESITDKATYNSAGKNAPVSDITLTDLLSEHVDIPEMAHRVNEALCRGKKDVTSRKKVAQQHQSGAELSASFYGVCRAAKDLLNKEIRVLYDELQKGRDIVLNGCHEMESGSVAQFKMTWVSFCEQLDALTRDYTVQKVQGRLETRQTQEMIATRLAEERKKLLDQFLKKYPPQEFAEEYARIYSLEPSYDAYECCKEMPRNIHISSLEYDLNAMGVCKETINMLAMHYHCMYRGNYIRIPFCVPFNQTFNFMFKFQDIRTVAAEHARNIGMRMFMMLPPGKLRCTFIDPGELGSNFAMFMRLVDPDDRTNEVVNGQIWSDPSDIEAKLKVLTDRIANVTQRCLQGKYEDIYEYNCAAEQNAEPYQLLMLMNFPAGLTDCSLTRLEEIVRSGPKCGVFTIIYYNLEEYDKLPERSQTLVHSIENKMNVFCYADFRITSTGKRQTIYTGDTSRIFCEERPIPNIPIEWRGRSLPDVEVMDSIIATLKKGIKDAEKIVIDVDKINKAERIESTMNGIRIPIGVHGANEVQYFTLGAGGSHHALIAGITNSGKSSLLHTIILQMLMQYDQDELSMYLVDFKRGVEFKIYAEYILPVFRVVAIESEREFGYHILQVLEREQKMRATQFKKNHVEKIEDFRALGKKMPRIVIILDEFQELFANSSDELSKKASESLERIVRQGRAFGVHLILSTQSYSNISGMNQAVYDQMAVRIVLKCSEADANLLLKNGSSEIDQISVNEPGRAVYNSEAGHRDYNSHFRVAYIEPSKYGDMLLEISNRTRQYADPNQPTRILLANIEDNSFCFFNKFEHYGTDYETPYRFYIGEPLSIQSQNYIPIDFARKDSSNLLMVGGDADKARDMFAFSILSLCIHYHILHRAAPAEPIITFLNYHPLRDSFFTDIPRLISEQLPAYVRNIDIFNSAQVQKAVVSTYDLASGDKKLEGDDRYFFVLGYQRAEELKLDSKEQSDEIDDLFHISFKEEKHSNLSFREMFRAIMREGAVHGVHTILWQDSFQALYVDEKELLSYFNMRIAFDMSKEEYARFINLNESNELILLGKNNALFYSRAMDNVVFRPYQTPDEEWIKGICQKLK